MSEQRLVVIGGVAAGMSAAAKASRVNPNMSIKVFTEEDYISYGACGFPYYVSGEIEKETNLVARTAEQFKSQGIDVMTNHKVTKIYPQKKFIEVTDLQSGNVIEEAFDKLVIATGASPFMPPIEGTDLENVFALRNMEQSIKIKNYVQQKKPQNAVIVGGGYIGLEMAEALHKSGCRVTIVELAPEIIPNMDEDISSIVHEYLTSFGINIFTGEKVVALGGNQYVDKVVTDKREINTDLVLLAVGTVPNSSLAKEAGIELGPKNAIKVNNRMETSMRDIYAAGDCATVTHRLTGEDVYIPLGTTANKQGKVAGENAAGGNAKFEGVLGTGIAKVFDMEIARTGLSTRELKQQRLEYVETMVKSRTSAHYYPGSSQIHIKLLVEKRTGKLLGGQIFGGKGSGKRIDVFATSLHLGAKVGELLEMDLAYAPPFSPVYDSILVALTNLEKARKKKTPLAPYKNI